MITGDEISVIYEGQLSNTDTSTVKALKVVDEFHKKNKLKNHTTRGKVMALTPNTITIKNKKALPLPTLLPEPGSITRAASNPVTGYI